MTTKTVLQQRFTSTSTRSTIPTPAGRRWALPSSGLTMSCTSASRDFVRPELKALARARGLCALTAAEAMPQTVGMLGPEGRPTVWNMAVRLAWNCVRICTHAAALSERR